MEKFYEKTKETYFRSVLKSISYRLYSSFLVTPIIVYIITGNFLIGVAVGITEFLVKPFTYFIFERGWSHIKWGYKNKK